MTIFPEELRHQQTKNNAALGTTALPEQGAQQRKKKKKQPSASEASQAQSDQRSLEQKGQQLADKELRSLEKTRIINEINLAAREVDKEKLRKHRPQTTQLEDLIASELAKQVDDHHYEHNSLLRKGCFRTRA